MSRPTATTPRFSIRDAPFVTWIVLIVLTALALVLGRGHDVGGMSTRVAGLLVLVVAFAKVGAVMHTFMELGRAGPVLRGLAVAAVSLVAAVVIALFLLV